jgi:hypothetical protein
MAGCARSQLSAKGGTGFPAYAIDFSPKTENRKPPLNHFM